MAADSLERFRDLAGRFQEAAARGDACAMERILAERRELLAELGAGAGPAGRREETLALLREILDSDRESAALLERQREALRAELVELHEGRRGLRGYGAGGSRTAKWIDERG